MIGSGIAGFKTRKTVVLRFTNATYTTLTSTVLPEGYIPSGDIANVAYVASGSNRYFGLITALSTGSLAANAIKTYGTSATPLGTDTFTGEIFFTVS